MIDKLHIVGNSGIVWNCIFDVLDSRVRLDRFYANRNQYWSETQGGGAGRIKNAHSKKACKRNQIYLSRKCT